MASKQHTTLVATFIFVFMMNNVYADTALIEQVCDRTIDFTVCKSTLYSNTLSPSADTKGLANIVLQQALIKAFTNLAKIAKLRKGSNPPEINNGLFVCKQLYGPARDALSNSIRNLNGNLTRAANFASVAGDDGRTCESSFRPSPSPLTKENGAFYTLSKIASDIIVQLL